MPLLRPTAILRAALKQWKDVNWPSTLNLPKSAFPARASAAQLQEYRQQCADDLYAWQRAHRPSGNDFVLHDGPPYGNGAVHVGHALKKVLKDLILRWELAKGRKVQYRPGWDCHGLPIELKALQQARTQREEARTLEDAPGEEAAVAGRIGMTAVEIRQRARELAAETIEVQKRSFREWGVMGEWDGPYKTMDRDFEIRQLGVFREMVKKGLISRHHRPVYWSPSSRTALAEAELEYDESHECSAAFVKMPFVRLPKVFQGPSAVEPGRLSALIWTTTPWTLPANMAIAVKDGIQYAVVELTTSSGKDSETEQVVVAQDRVGHVLSYLPSNTCHEVVMEDIDGSQLADGQAACFNFFQNSESPILSVDFVTATSGTGLVHMAPGHGLDDYQVCQAKRLGPALAPVDDAGRYTAEVFPSDSGQSKALTGMDVQTEGVKAVLDLLDDPARYLPSGLWQPNTSLVLASHLFTHKNPIDWRTKQPVIVRATAQWFADASALQQSALGSLDDVTFVPESGKNRLSAFLRGRSQLCISRQRAWGVPIPALYNKETAEACISDESVEHIIKVLDARGTDAWFKDAEDDEAWLHSSLEPGAWVRGEDTMDVWFDSGTSWTTLEPRGDGKAVSDVYVEGTDQHRGWFQSSLLTHVAVQDVGETPKAPYSKLITHGFVLDAEGRKMSKSVGNVIAPEQIIDGSLLPPVKTKKKGGRKAAAAEETSEERPKYDSLGPDVLRLWVASSDYTKDVSIAVPLLQEVHNALAKYRVTFKWLLGVLSDFQPDRVSDLTNLTFADTAVLYRFAQVSQAVEQAFDEYAFHKGVKELNSFVNIDLSAFYFETCKDTLYTGRKRDRQRIQMVLALLTRHILRLLGPVLPHLVQEVSTLMSPAMREWMGDPLRTTWTGQSELLSAIEGHDAQYLDGALNESRAISAAVQKAQEEARRAGKVKSGLACKVEIHVPADADAHYHVPKWHRDGELADLLVVSKVEVVIASDGTESIESPTPAWRFEQDVELPAVPGSRQMTVVVVPPEGAKCVRCWKYTAEEEGVPCQRCQDVLKEREHVAT
ncbi:isoleucine-tRNA ligase [Friedmanniomyces endolithicus]|nr:isoleucine-tRNA ligase [Friedmanniomyces endolithicus]